MCRHRWQYKDSFTHVYKQLLICDRNVCLVGLCALLVQVCGGRTCARMSVCLQQQLVVSISTSAHHHNTSKDKTVVRKFMLCPYPHTYYVCYYSWALMHAFAFNNSICPTNKSEQQLFFLLTIYIYLYIYVYIHICTYVHM